ncbi:hypothetical protein [Vitiosangium sp. GDMCC 1.1324]|uniref:hypothetical protein n=1 Tax=Vitiosangium sp. (strain GDMCC 1.1324) TaxID=2138576 RepID=UPI000D3C7A5F|nr:hypothetical protein [Vitiosangium sp. GDMCC 1.1324]PTL83167.1 hypothetical protein DAT35_14270 [Vitiosangium sp. GDMCC 1.1324]
MERSRPTVRAPEATAEAFEPVSLGEVPSLPWVLEQVRAPDASRHEVDALLRAVVLPPGPGESARERADLLHGILADTQVREFTGSDGRRVDHVAVMALAELGFPYALEVPPELFAEARAAGGNATGTRPSSFSRPRVGAVLTSIAGFVELLPGLVLGMGLEMWPLTLGWALLVTLTSFLPAFVAASEPVLRRRWLHYLLLLLVVLPGLPSLGTAAFLLGDAKLDGWSILVFLLPLALAMMRFVGAGCLYGEAPAADAPEPDEAT